MKTLIALLGALLCVPLMARVEAAGIISGQVLGQDQRGLAGIFVTARHSVSNIETTVYAGADGRYALPPLADGSYTLRAHHSSYEDARSEVTLSDAGANVVLTLKAAADPLLHASSATWFAAVPDSAQKREFILNCATCHEVAAGRIVKDGQLRDKAKWLEAFNLMKALDRYAVIPPDFDIDAYAEWLARSFSPAQVAKLAPQQTASAQAQDSTFSITEYPVPLANELPHDLVVGPDKRIWVTAFWNSQMWAMDAATGTFESYAVNDEPNTVAQVRALEFDAAGMLWMVNGGTESVVRLDTRTRKFATYKLGMYPHDLVIDSHGDIWVNDYFAKAERVARVAARDGTVTHIPLPSAKLPASAGVPLPYGLQVDGKDRLWSSQLAANTLARYDIASGKAQLYTMPDDNVGPRRMAVGLDGRIWIPEFNTGRLTSFEPDTERFETFDTGDSTAGVYDVAVDPRNGDVWLAASLASELIHFDVKRKVFTHYPLPTEPAYMRHLAIDPQNGDVWSAYSSLPTAVPKIVRLRRR